MSATASAAATVGAPASAPAPAVRARPRPHSRTRPRSRVAGGAAWIVLVAVLLAGIVAMNVAVLRLNVQFDKLGRQKVSLIGQNAALSSQLSSAAATERIQRLARERMGLVPASPDRTTYIRIDR
jgi:cell division protein FtsL